MIVHIIKAPSNRAKQAKQEEQGGRTVRPSTENHSRVGISTAFPFEVMMLNQYEDHPSTRRYHSHHEKSGDQNISNLHPTAGHNHHQDFGVSHHHSNIGGDFGVGSHGGGHRGF